RWVVVVLVERQPGDPQLIFRCCPLGQQRRLAEPGRRGDQRQPARAARAQRGDQLPTRNLLSAHARTAELALPHTALWASHSLNPPPNALNPPPPSSRTGRPPQRWTLAPPGR